MSLTLAPDALILAVDIGTSSVRAMLFDLQGRAIEGMFTQTHYTLTTTPDGGAVIDPVALSTLIFACIDAVLAQAGPLTVRIAAVAIDTLVGNLMGMTAQGSPTTPIYTWADSRGGSNTQPLKAILGDYTHRTGCRVHPSYWPLRLLWIAEHLPDTFQQTAYWLSLGDYVYYQIFGVRQTSYSAASWSGLLNRFSNSWDPQTLEALPINVEQLSEIAVDPLHGLSGTWAERWPALRTAYWLPAIADGVAANVGAGCLRPDQVALSVGTSGAMRIVVPGRPASVPEGLFAYCVDAKQSLVGGALSNAGNLYAWMQHVLANAADETTLAAVAALPPDSHGLTILPFLAGERAPGWNDRAQAVFMGMTLNTSPEHLIRAALESVAYRFYQISQRLTSLLPTDHIYVANGAAITQSPLWLQIMADVLNAPVFATQDAESTIRGTALLAAMQLTSERVPGLANDATVKRFMPDAQRHAIYIAAAERQQALYDRLFVKMME